VPFTIKIRIYLESVTYKDTSPRISYRLSTPVYSHSLKDRPCIHY
jgi:hypothetical protein